MRRLLLTYIFCVLVFEQAAAQKAPSDYDPIRFAAGQNEIVISKTAQVPRQLARSASATGCRYESMLATDPIRIIRAQPGTRVVFALVPCVSVPYLPMQVFEFSHRDPVLVQLPVMTADRGFGATSLAGGLQWDAQTMTLTATHGSDMCPSPMVRHSYSLNTKSGYSVGQSLFQLVRIDWLRNRCSGERDWQLLWEAPAWSLLIP